MRNVQPSVRLIGRPSLDPDAIVDYLNEVGGGEWWDRIDPLIQADEMAEGEGLVEFAGRLCYRSWKPGLNPNVTKVREDSKDYFANILDSGHGSVLEHGFYVFVFHNVSRVFTHELVRHRVGTCLAGDAEITLSTRGSDGTPILRRETISTLHDRWHNGVKDSLGRVRHLPSSRSRKVRVLNEETQFFEEAKILDVYESGVQSLMQITTDDGKTLRCTKKHAIFTERGWVKAGDLSFDDAVAVSGKRNLFAGESIPKTLRQGIGLWVAGQRKVLIKVVDTCAGCGDVFDRDDLELDHKIPVIEDLSLALSPDNLQPMCSVCHRGKTNQEQAHRRQCNLAGSKFVRIVDLQYDVAEEITYDLTIEGPWNNFLANGMVVHNSISQESMRFVRLTDIPFWQPEWARNDPELMAKAQEVLEGLEEFQVWMADHFGLDDDGVPFTEKKAKTSYMRRYAPDGVATSIVWGANYRTLRHVIEMRTSEHAEEEIVEVFDQVAAIMSAEAPNVMQDLQYQGDGHWSDSHRKV